MLAIVRLLVTSAFAIRSSCTTLSPNSASVGRLNLFQAAFLSIFLANASVTKPSINGSMLSLHIWLAVFPERTVSADIAGTLNANISSNIFLTAFLSLNVHVPFFHGARLGIGRQTPPAIVSLPLFCSSSTSEKRALPSFANSAAEPLVNSVAKRSRPFKFFPKLSGVLSLTTMGLRMHCTPGLIAHSQPFPTSALPITVGKKAPWKMPLACFGCFAPNRSRSIVFLTPELLSCKTHSITAHANVCASNSRLRSSNVNCVALMLRYAECGLSSSNPAIRTQALLESILRRVSRRGDEYSGTVWPSPTAPEFFSPFSTARTSKTQKERRAALLSLFRVLHFTVESGKQIRNAEKAMFQTAWRHRNVEVSPVSDILICHCCPVKKPS